MTADREGTTLFETAIGRCGLAWRNDAVVAVQIPERTDDATIARLAAKAGVSATSAGVGTVPPWVGEVVSGIVALLAGDDVDLTGVPVDLGTPGPLEEAVWATTRTIPRGSALTYGEVAARIGQPGAAQAVGRALGTNPCPIVIPCHRVVGAGGALTGFSAHGGVETKRRMLLIEGCPIVAPTLFDAIE